MRQSNRGSAAAETARTRRHHMRWLVLLPLLASLASCSESERPSPGADRAKVAALVVGRSSRDEVFETLGRPSRTERNSAGESWMYEWAGGRGGRATALQGAATASSVVGAFVP